MMSEREPSGFWPSLLDFILRNKLVVGVLTALLIYGGISVAPFEAFDQVEWTRDRVPVDAIPDIGENQQIVFTQWNGRSPRDIEDQVTYPLTTALLGVPGVRTVRSFSMFGFSSIYVIFEDGVDFYWSRSRILEKLNSLPSGTLPDGVAPALGPDATALGQVFWYTLEGRDEAGEPVGGWDLHELRSIQDWTVRYALQSAEGVAEVASVGGYVAEYQIDVDPEALKAAGVSLAQVAKAVKGSNLDVGARTMEINRIEYVVRGKGFVESIEDLEETVIVARENKPIRIRDVGRVHLGPESRRGALDVAGAEAVGGVVVARYGMNPQEAIDNIKARIAEIQPGLPTRTLADGTVSRVTIVPFYDRSNLISETIGTLSTALWQQLLITIIVVLLMLRNLRSSLLISSLLPLGVVGAFVWMKYTGVSANIMSLAGIAIAIGTMVDMGIVFTENIVAALDDAPEDADRAAVIRDAAAEVAPAVLTSVLTTVVSFLPVFALTASEGKLFTPLAFTKTFAVIMAYLVALLVIPVLAHLLFWPSPGPVRDTVSPANRALKSVFRIAHWRDWVVVGLGGLVTFVFHAHIGLFVILVGVLRLVEPLLPRRQLGPLRVDRVPVYLEVIVAVFAVTLVLTMDWMPLGFEKSLWLNVLSVAGSIFALMALFGVFMMLYENLLRWMLDHKALFMVGPLLMIFFGATVWLGFDKTLGWLPEPVRTHSAVSGVADEFPGLGREFMPPFDEGSYLVMPTTMPHASFGEALDQLKLMDASIQAIPEVELTVGKLGRVESALDPAPVSMFETVVNYKPEYRIDEDGNRVRQWRDHIQSPDDIWHEIVKAAEMPGLTSAPKLMPINTRIVMLQSGMRAPIGIKIKGPDLETIEAFGLELEEYLQNAPGVRSETVFAERIVGKPYLEIDIDRRAIGRFGLTIEQVQDVIRVAIGGMQLTTTVEGRERYGVRVRYMREERDSVDELSRILVTSSSGQEIPLEQIADIRYVRGPQVIKSEDTFLTGYVIFDKVEERAETDVVEEVRAYLQTSIDEGELVVPEGVSYTFAGSYQNQVRSEKRLQVLIPIALMIVFLLLYLQFRSVATSAMIFTSVAVAMSGGFALLWLYGQPWFLDVEVFGTGLRDLMQMGTLNLSVAVWVGFIALIGIAVDDGVVMATYLHQRFERGEARTVAEIRDLVVEAGKRRVRPCLMTTATTILALLPVITSTGRGSDVMVPMAVPILGGMVIELLTLFVVPVLYAAYHETRHALK